MAISKASDPLGGRVATSSLPDRVGVEHQVEAGLGVAGVQLEGAIEGTDRFLREALLRQREPELGMDGG